MTYQKLIPDLRLEEKDPLDFWTQVCKGFPRSDANNRYANNFHSFFFRTVFLIASPTLHMPIHTKCKR